MEKKIIIGKRGRIMCMSWISFMVATNANSSKNLRLMYFVFNCKVNIGDLDYNIIIFIKKRLDLKQ